MSADLLFAAQCCCGVDPPDNFCAGWESCLPQTASLSIRIQYEETRTFNDLVLDQRIIETETTAPMIKKTVIVEGVPTTFLESSFGSCSYVEERFLYYQPNSIVLYPDETDPNVICLHSLFCPCASGVSQTTLGTIGSCTAGFGVLPGDISIVCADGCPAGALHPITGTKGARLVFNRVPIDTATLFEITNPDNGCTSESYETDILISPEWARNVDFGLDDALSSPGCVTQATWTCNTNGVTVEEGEPTGGNTWYCGDQGLISPTDPFGVVCAVLGGCPDGIPQPFPVVYNCGTYKVTKRYTATITVS